MDRPNTPACLGAQHPGPPPPTQTPPPHATCSPQSRPVPHMPVHTQWLPPALTGALQHHRAGMQWPWACSHRVAASLKLSQCDETQHHCSSQRASTIRSDFCSLAQLCCQQWVLVVCNFLTLELRHTQTWTVWASMQCQQNSSAVELYSALSPPTFNIVRISKKKAC